MLYHIVQDDQQTCLHSSRSTVLSELYAPLRGLQSLTAASRIGGRNADTYYNDNPLNYSRHSLIVLIQLNIIDWATL